MNRIADLVVEKLVEKQKEYDEQFHAQLKNTMQDNLGNARPVTEEELILSEIARLMTLLSSYEENDEFEKAAIIHNKIKKLENKLNRD